MSIYDILNGISIPWAYGRFQDRQDPPFLIAMGNGQLSFDADNTIYYKGNYYRIEFYFKEKNEDTEDEIESALLSGGFIYEKSEDIYIESENLFVIYYYV